MLIDEFYVVWNEFGGTPTYKHLSVDAAKTEAERLARKSLGQKFHVLRCIGTCQSNDVLWTTPKDDDIPF